MKDETSRFLPLSPAALHILLALAGDDLHGYGIMREVARQSWGQYKIGPGTLYDNLQKLTQRGLVKEVRRALANDDTRRRYYKLTSFGRRVLAEDLERLRAVLTQAKLDISPSEPGESS